MFLIPDSDLKEEEIASKVKKLIELYEAKAGKPPTLVLGSPQVLVDVQIPETLNVVVRVQKWVQPYHWIVAQIEEV